MPFLLETCCKTCFSMFLSPPNPHHILILSPPYPHYIPSPSRTLQPLSNHPAPSRTLLSHPHSPCICLPFGKESVFHLPRNATTIICCPKLVIS